MEKVNYKERPDLMGRTGSITKHFKIVEALEYPTGVSIRVCDEWGEEYGVSLEDVDLD